MNRAKFWTVLGSASVVMGLLIAGAHVASNDSAQVTNRNARLARLHSLMNEGRSDVRSSLFRKTLKPRLELVAGLDDSDSVSGTTTDKETSTATEVKAAKKDEKKKVVAKDKKKKKKKTIKGKGEPQPESESEESAEESDEAADVSPMIGNQNAAAAPAGQVDPNALPTTVEQWVAYLLAYPDFERVSKFIQLAQTNVVKAEVFYPVIEKLLSLENSRMHELAVLALKSTPSAASFTMLAAVANEASLAAKLKAQAIDAMRTYRRLEYVRLLASVVALDEDAAASRYAIILLQDSAGQHLQNVRMDVSADTNVTQGNRSPASSAIKTFEAMIGSLKHISETSPNSSLSSAAANAVMTIEALLSRASA